MLNSNFNLNYILFLAMPGEDPNPNIILILGIYP